MTGGYAYQDAFIRSATAAAAAGTQVAQVPHHSFSVWSKYSITPRLSGGLGLVRRSDMFAAITPLVVPAGYIPVVLPGYTRADAAVFYTFNEHWRVQGNVENLFNKKYFANADSITNISPGSPRAAKLALITRF
jgi:catecholate siderophore receptor